MIRINWHESYEDYREKQKNVLFVDWLEILLNEKEDDEDDEK